MGGEPDGDGCINAEKLIQTIKHEFEMTIDIEKLIEEIDEDGSGQIEFDEFTALLTGGAPEDEDGEDDWTSNYLFLSQIKNKTEVNKKFISLTFHEELSHLSQLSKLLNYLWFVN